MKGQGIGQGAVLLATAGIIVKVLGALFKIPIGALLGPEGNAHFSIAYNIYALLFVISTAGLPIAMSKTTAEVYARNGDTAWVLKKVLFPFGALGLFLSLLLFFTADLFSAFMGAPQAADAIRAIAPAVFFVTPAAILRGYYQGLGNMMPTAVSEVLEASSKLVFGLAAAYLAISYSLAEEIVAAGAVLGVTIGAAISAAYLFFKKRMSSNVALHRESGAVRRLIKTAVPITLGASVVSLTNVIDSGLIMNLLTRIGFVGEHAMWLFGSYNYAATVFNLPGVLITTLGVSLIPAITKARVTGEYDRMSKTLTVAYKMALAFSFAAAFGLFFLGEEVMGLLYGGVGETAVLASGRMLSLLAIAIAPLAIASLTGATLQALGDVKTPMYSMALGAFIKVFLNLVLVGNSSINIYGACLATAGCYMIVSLVNVAVLARKREVSVTFGRVILGPAFAGFICGAGAKFIFDILADFMVANVALIPALLSGVLLWISCIMLLKMITKDDINLLFVQKSITIFSKNH